MTRKGLDIVIEKIAHEGVLPCAYYKEPGVAVTTGEEEGRGFYAAARQIAPDLRHKGCITMARELRVEWKCERWKSNGRCGWRFPGLKKLREMFDKKHGPQQWDETNEWERPTAPDDEPF
jgi:hypothetical protein